MAMTPTANNTDVYVPSIDCLLGDDAADVLTPPVSAAAFAPDEVPAVLLAVEPALLVLVLGFFTTLVAKPGGESVLSPTYSLMASGSSRNKKLTNPRLVDIEDGIYILQVNGPKKPRTGHYFAPKDVARADTGIRWV